MGDATIGVKGVVNGLRIPLDGEYRGGTGAGNLTAFLVSMVNLCRCARGSNDPRSLPSGVKSFEVMTQSFTADHRLCEESYTTGRFSSCMCNVLTAIRVLGRTFIATLLNFHQLHQLHLDNQSSHVSPMRYKCRTGARNEYGVRRWHYRTFTCLYLKSMSIYRVILIVGRLGFPYVQTHPSILC